MDSPPSIEDEELLDEVNTIPETPNTFDRGLIQRLGIAEAEAVSTFLNNNIQAHTRACTHTNLLANVLEEKNKTL